ncbi:hypothetical protein RCL1_006395 [Eukaryota sp. TZLM3-RCL]
MDWYTDDVQEESLRQTIDLLLAAGYFRARLSALSAFDRVVGGMAWCIAASNVDINVGVVFAEGSSIKDKLKIAESIVNALIEMNCPNPPQPHQISRLDISALFPVVQWLVKQAIKFRAETASRVRSFAEFQYSRLLSPVSPSSSLPPLPSSQCKRCFKQPKRLRKSAQSVEDKVALTLLEFGVTPKHIPKFLLTGDQNSTEVNKSQEQSFEPASISASSFMRTVSQEKQVSTANIEQALKQQTSEVQSAQAGYLKEVEKAAMEEANSVHAKNAQIRKKRDLVGAQKEEIINQIKMIEGEVGKVDEQRETITTEIAKLNKKLNKFENLKETHPEEISRLSGCLENLDEISNNYDQLKTNSKLIGKQLEQDIEKLKMEKKEIEQELNEKISQLNQSVEKEDVRLSKLTVIYEENQSIVDSLQSDIADFPIRSELSQYERRFSDLFSALSLLLNESRRYFDRYNALIDKKSVLEREISLVKNLKAQLPAIGKQKILRENLVSKLSSVANSLVEHLTSLEHKLSDNQKRLEDLIGQRNSCSQSIRTYFFMIKELKQELIADEQLRV